MDVTATLIEITAFDPSVNAMVVGRITNRNDPRATTANGQSWLPILQTAPSVGTSVFDGSFTGAGQIQLGDFTITLADGLGDMFSRLVWSGADIKVYAGDMKGGNLPLMFRAVGDGASRKGRLELQVSLKTRSALLDVNLLTQSYAGIGNLEGDAGLKGTMKPWVFGYAKFCRPVLIDPVRQIYQVSAYGPVENITNVFEGGQEITDVTDYTGTLESFLSGSGPAQGKWWRLNRYGLFRLGSQPLYQITCHVKGDTNAVVGGTALTKVGDIIGRIMSLTTTMPVKASSLAQLNANIPQPFDDYFDEQQTVSEALTRFLTSVGGYYTFDESGNLIFGLVRFGASVLNLDNQNRVEPTVLGINALPTSAPVWYLRLGAAQCHFVHDASNLPAIIIQQAGDISAIKDIANSKNKTFPASNTPPTGAIDGDQWPDTSVSPQTMRRYSAASNTWVATSNQITTANQVPYSNGVTIEALRPAEGGSNVTENRVSIGFLGQAALATKDYVSFGSPYLLESAGGTSATLNAFKTLLGQAASILGQASWATFNGLVPTTVVGQISRLQSDGYIESATVYKSGLGFLSAFFPEDVGSNRTENRVASGFSGQGPWATSSIPTKSVFTPNSNLFKYPRPLLNLTPQQIGWADFDVNNSGTFILGNTDYAGFGGPCYAVSRTSGIATTHLWYYDQPIPADGQTYTISFTARFIGASAGNSYVLPLTASRQAIGDGLSCTVISGPDGNGLARYKATITNRRDGSGNYGQFIRIHVGAQYPATSGDYQDTYFFDVKVEGGYEVTPIGAVSSQTAAAQNILYDGATSAQALKPEEAGGNRTENRSSAGFAGQGSFATANNINRGNYGSYFNLNAISLNYSVTRSDGVNVVTEALTITEIGISSGFRGQGALATKNKVGGNDFEVSYNGQGGRVERDGNGDRIYANNGNLAVKIGF